MPLSPEINGTSCFARLVYLVEPRRTSPMPSEFALAPVVLLTIFRRYGNP